MFPFLILLARYTYLNHHCLSMLFDKIFSKLLHSFRFMFGCAGFPLRSPIGTTGRKAATANHIGRYTSAFSNNFFVINCLLLFFSKLIFPILSLCHNLPFSIVTPPSLYLYILILVLCLYLAIISCKYFILNARRFRPAQTCRNGWGTEF